MTEKIAFLSSGPYGISPDMRIIQNQLSLKNADYDFTYFAKNTSNVTPEDAKAVRDLKVNFCAKAENIICIDASLPVRNMFEGSHHSRIFITSQYDYIFKHLMNKSEEKKNNLTNFTHIIYTSPIAKKSIENTFTTDGAECIECPSPLAEDICCEKSINSILKKLIHIYPQIEGKKILSVIRTGSKFSPDELDKLDIGEFMKKLSNEYIIITNAEELIQKAHSSADCQKARILYINSMISASDLLYISNAVITNSSHLASAFAVKRLPLYHIDYCDNHFVNYMNSRKLISFPNKAGEIAKQISAGTFDTSICKELSYPIGKRSTEIIHELIKNKTL